MNLYKAEHQNNDELDELLIKLKADKLLKHDYFTATKNISAQVAYETLLSKFLDWKRKRKSTATQQKQNSSQTMKQL